MHIEIENNSLPTDVVVGSARTCYSSKGLIQPDKDWTNKKTLIMDLFHSGHHTTSQHSNFTFKIEGMSRYFIWRVLHSHAYYNSEQVSQRYAKMSIDNFFYPIDNKEIFKEHYTKQFKDYEYLIEKLLPLAQQLLPKFKQNQAKKVAQEIARYVLPQGTTAYLYHTVNLITVLRYIAIADKFKECQEEGVIFKNMLIEVLLNYDPDLKEVIDEISNLNIEIPEQYIDFKINEVNSNNSEDYQNVIIKHIVKDNDIFDIPFHTNLTYDHLRLSQIKPDISIASGFQSLLKISLSADAQNQRHRTSRAFREHINLNIESYKPNIDYYLPDIFNLDTELKEFYIKSIENCMQFAKNNKNGIYGLSNAHYVSIIEWNDFQNFHHKCQMRLCYNAQKEIFDMTKKQILGLEKEGINSSVYAPPCIIRNKMNVLPCCPEGNRYCGKKVWKMPNYLNERGMI